MRWLPSALSDHIGVGPGNLAGLDQVGKLPREVRYWSIFISRDCGRSLRAKAQRRKEIRRSSAIRFFAFLRLCEIHLADSAKLGTPYANAGLGHDDVTTYPLVDWRQTR